MAWVERLPSGKWRGGYRDMHGRKTQLGGFALRRHALAWAEEGEQAALRGESYDSRAGRTLFREWAAAWLDARIVEPSTADTERYRYDTVVERWGDVPIGAIEPLAVQRWVKELAARMAPGTVRKYHGMLSVILSDATKPPNKLLETNPAIGVTLPTLPQGREVYLTVPQVDKLDVELSDDQTGRMVTWFKSYTGFRWGEVAGLHVNRLDMNRGRVHVVDVLSQTTGKSSQSAFSLKSYPKEARGTRSMGMQRWVPLPDHVAERLEGYLSLFKPVDCGLHARCPGLLFAAPRRWDPVRQPMIRQTYGRWVFHPAAVRADLPKDVRPHDLRHTYASWLVTAGVPLRDVQYLLGHKSIRTTERYAHFAPDSGERARQVLDRGTNRGTTPSIEAGQTP